jgi:translation initiation factor 1
MAKQRANDTHLSQQKRVIYQEFGNTENAAALERAKPENPPTHQTLTIQATRKGRKGKTVTVISGFQASAQTLESLLKQLKTQCGAGGTVKDSTLEIQGDHAQKLAQVLVQMGYKAKISGG